MKVYQKLFLWLLILGTVSGCSQRENLQISEGFYAKPSSVVITQVSGLEEPGFYRRGNQGVVDFMVSDIMTDSMQEKLRQMKADTILNDYYYKRYGSRLASRSMNVTEVKNPINKKSLQSDPNDDLQHAPYDFRFLKKSYGADYAMVLDPHSFGVIRSYYGFIPTSAPKGYADLSIYFVDLSNNSIVGEYKASIEQTVEGEWDTPPEYASLTRASKDALAKALSDAYTYFFH